MDTLLSRELLKAVADGAGNVTVVVSYLPTVVTHLQSVHRWIQCTGHPLTRMPFRRSTIRPLKCKDLINITQTSNIFCVRDAKVTALLLSYLPVPARDEVDYTRLHQHWKLGVRNVYAHYSA